MYKKILSMMMIGLMVVTLLSGCGNKQESSETENNASANDSSSSTTNETSGETAGETTKTQEPVTISLWTLSSRQDGVEAVLDSFKEKYPEITIEVAYASTDGHKQNLKVAATSNALPTLWFNWGGSLGGFYTENGLTYDLKDYAKTNNWSDKFYASALDLSILHGELAGYPTSLCMVGIYYRKDIFEKYGLSEPTTLEEFENVCKTLKENGETPLSTAGGGAGWHVMRLVEQLIEHYAGDQLHDSMNAFEESYDNEAVVAALAKYKEFVDQGYFNEGFVTADSSECTSRLYSGDAVMVTEGNWCEKNILNAEQDNSLYGYFSFPSGGTNRLSSFVELYQINASVTDAELDAAIKFMDEYYGAEAVDANPTYYKYPMPMKDIPMPDNYVNTKLMVEDIESNGSFTITDQAFPAEVAAALFDAQDQIALGSMTPEEGATAIQAAIESYLANK